ncbi:MAG: OmpA family protein [Proteobacteria bacterium]|nr:OmpA family protein [Pseudomonadota bacterium]
MDFMQQLRNLCAMLLLAAPAAVAADAPASGVPPYPATLQADCAAVDCPDTLHSAHDITFISRISFPVGSGMLTREASNELLRMLVELESFAVIEHVEIIGHSDPSGPANFNRWLSEVRAKRVQDYFAQSGVDPRKVTLRGAGSDEPLPGAIDPAEHRRVEVRITLHPFL